MSWSVAGALGFLALMCPSALDAQVLAGMALFEQHCGACHSSPAAGSRAPDRIALSQRTPEAILEAITTGSMALNAQALTLAQKRIVAEQLALRPIGAAAAGAASAMKNICGLAASPDAGSATGRWSGWGVDRGNSRYQPSGGLTAAQMPNLSLKWAFAFPNGSSAFGQPAVAGGRLYVGSDNGFVYALNASTGCVYWSYQAQAGVRTAISVGANGTVEGGSTIYFGDLKGNVYAVNAGSGELVWTKRADPHPLTRITGAPMLDAGRLYVPLSSLEEGSGANPKYECCTFRGGVIALDARTGNEVWRAYTIPVPPKRIRKNASGTQLWGPAGGSVWSAPTIDTKRGLLYVATGNAYNNPAAETSDAVVAYDLKTGRLRWSRQVTPNDAYVVGCGANAASRENCPDDEGPDFDFGNSPILRTLPNGRSIITLGQKSGVAWGLDPDREGAILWQKRLGQGSALGGMEWGSAADDQLGYFPIADAQHGPAVAGGLHAVRLTNGDEVWRWRPANDCQPAQRNCVEAHSAAISVIPGVLFAGTTTGMLRAHATTDGHVLWEFNTAREFDAVNGVPGKGGSLNGPGPVIAEGMVFTNSGYAYLGSGLGGNVLLAFAPQ
ncbi:MAG TPA: PQQ-binding-like beta-propeller repeat protein [Vicinamibacterales bacterium]|nr:PQQ-binding-like beta-propeller repeat protein [Vicinamibacterales bacterium]